MDKHSHYFKDVSHLDHIDIYRILELYKVTDQAVGHAIKKLLCCGARGAKDKEQDIQEAIDTLMRRKEMIAENEKCVKENRGFISLLMGIFTLSNKHKSL